MNKPLDINKLEYSLLALRLGVFIVMFMWTLDKFVNPGHAAAIFANFYFLEGIGATVLYALAAIEMVVILMFVAGVARTWTYGAVFLLHGVSTLASFNQYLNPFSNLLFFAAWPMLAACFALFMLRGHDNKFAYTRSANQRTGSDTANA